jgi:hypothetical protein
MTNGNESGKTTTTIEIDKELFLKFKALCVLRELKISGEIEKMIRSWVDERGTDVAAAKPGQKKLSNPPKVPARQAPSKGTQALTEESLDSAEKEAEG